MGIGMTGTELIVLIIGIIGYCVAVGMAAVVAIRWRYRGEVIKPSPKPLSIKDSTLYQCRTCGCEWRRWREGFWNLSGEQVPCEKCKRDNMDEVAR